MVKWGIAVPTLAPSYTLNATVIYVGTSVNITAAVSDLGLGINASSCQYNINGTFINRTGTASQCTFNSISTLDLNLTVSVRVFDNATNNNTNSTSAVYYRDSTAPATTVNTSSYANGTWTRDAVTAALTATDAGSGVNATYYCINTSSACTNYIAYSAPVTNFTEGVNYLFYNSTDNVFNTETRNNISVWIDTTAPNTTIKGYNLSNASQAYTFDDWSYNNATINFSATDVSSGLNTTL